LVNLILFLNGREVFWPATACIIINLSNDVSILNKNVSLLYQTKKFHQLKKKVLYFSVMIINNPVSYDFSEKGR
jgi:hypothetical protein